MAGVVKVVEALRMFNPSAIFSLEADADFTDKQYHAVGFKAADAKKAVLYDGATAAFTTGRPPAGLLLNNPKAGVACDIYPFQAGGILPLIFDAALTLYDQVAIGTTTKVGMGIIVTDPTLDKVIWTVGTALSVGGDDIYGLIYAYLQSINAFA